MKSKNTFYYKFGFVLYCLLFILSTVEAGVTTKEVLECVASKGEMSLNSHYLSCQVDVFSAYQALKKHHTLLVDIRSQHQYQKISIPNSINIPIHMLKTKHILKQQKLFLIDDGGRLNDIPLLCDQLKRDGFDVSYITGGINAWRKLNKTLLGKPEELIKIDELGPEHFYFDSVANDLLIINIGTKQNQIISSSQNVNPLVPYFSIPLQNNSQLLLKKLKNIIKQFPQVTRVFIYDDNGKNYQSVKHLLKTKLKPSVFYLRGGYKAFTRFDLNHLALLKKKRVKPNQFFSCRG